MHGRVVANLKRSTRYWVRRRRRGRRQLQFTSVAVPFTYAVCMILAFIFALRAYTEARAPAWIRVAGVVASFLYPALYALARSHVIGA